MKNDLPAPVELTEAKIKKIARWEDSFRRIAGKAADGPVAAKTLYELQPEDLLAVVEKMKTAPEGAVEEEWAGPLLDRAQQLFQTDRSVWRERAEAGYHGLPCEADQTLTIFEKLLAAVALGDADPAVFETMLKKLIAMRDEPVPLRHYDDAAKEGYIEYFDDDARLSQASEGEILLYVLFVDELCGRKNVTAMRAKASACYGGNRAYACSWTKARDLLLELMNLDESPGYANSLGYIYFYGRTNNGKPEYAKAFYYFSIGAAGGMVESRYKLADMFQGGYGVPKNHTTCCRLITMLYTETLPLLAEQIYDCKFADVALRLGLLFRDGIGTEKILPLALSFLLPARFALRKRREGMDYYGDEKVEGHIDTALESVLSRLDIDPKPVRQISRSPEETLVRIPTRPEDYFEMRLRLGEDGKASAAVTRKSEADMRRNHPMLLTLTDALYCGMTDKLQFEAENVKLRGGERQRDGRTVIIRFDKIEDGRYYFGSDAAAELTADWTLKVPKE